MRITPVISVLFAILPFKCHSQSSQDPNNEIISYYNEVNVDSYRFAYESGDGTRREESGGFEDDVWTVRGKVSWTSPEGKTFAYTYIADDKGYRQTVGTQLGAAGPGFPSDEAPDDREGGPLSVPLNTKKGLLGGANR